MSLNPAQVHHARTSGSTDTHLARVWRRSVGTVRSARVGKTYRDHSTPPDIAPRQGNGRGMKPQAQPARVRRSYFHGC